MAEMDRAACWQRGVFTREARAEAGMEAHLAAFRIQVLGHHRCPERLPFRS